MRVAASGLRSGVVDHVEGAVRSYLDVGGAVLLDGQVGLARAYQGAGVVDAGGVDGRGPPIAPDDVLVEDGRELHRGRVALVVAVEDAGEGGAVGMLPERVMGGCAVRCAGCRARRP